ncbi:hypothetical protein K5V21_13190 [Clostridium sardiniense]|uniref:Uncharacterized protein n=1 Tax=Clostridium sardiniense TaxID=29369 RepID=A0ABS7L018_CLOSR|nr:hypothetical protein [Clostridium sardiniense]MBY0756405.1 hypothetical protein [Clostridium sardiniense]MDQ0459251.1 hypothetical protein [Clostridium sardiniense]
MTKSKNKLLIIISILLVLLVGSVVIDIILNKTYKTNYESFNSVDKEMFGQLSKVYNQFDENSDKLWGDKDKLNNMPLILIRTNNDKGIIRKYAYAINVKGIENSIFAEKMTMPSSLDLPTVYRLSKFDISMLYTWMPSNFGTVNIDNQAIFYFKYYPKMIENPDLYFDFSSFLIHESFHTYNQKNWTYDKNDGEYIENYPVNKENYALMGLEFKLLDKCMEKSNTEEIKKYLKEWTIVRTYRYEKWPQLIKETNTEAIEGTARYMEYKYNKLTGGNLMVLASKEKPYHVTFTHAFNCISDGIGETPTYLERPMKYETGAALGLIMDKLNINWKDDIEDSTKKNGETQYEILKKYFNISNKDTSEKVIKKIEEENNYNKLLKQGQKIVDIINRK